VRDVAVNSKDQRTTAVHKLLMVGVRSVVLAAALCTLLSSGLEREGLLFYDTFDEGDAFQSGWVKSAHPKYADQPLKVKPPTKPIPGYEEDKGIQLTQEMKHYGFGAKFNQPLTANGSDIVIQYELKMEEALACGGAYVKLLRADDGIRLADLSNDTPYVIMFGPDKCGTDAKVHFILQYQNPVSKEWGEHKFTGELKPKLDRSTHLYTLVIRSNNKFEIHIDTKPVANGDLLHNLDPPINPAEEISDPSDVKPADWEDHEFIPDVTAVKPHDWDETQPKKMPSKPEDKPKDWDESLPATVPDPSVARPEFWDDEEV
jgi:calnexin